jgi:hypothetical protein
MYVHYRTANVLCQDPRNRKFVLLAPNPIPHMVRTHDRRLAHPSASTASVTTKKPSAHTGAKGSLPRYHPHSDTRTSRCIPRSSPLTVASGRPPHRGATAAMSRSRLTGGRAAGVSGRAARSRWPALSCMTAHRRTRPAQCHCANYSAGARKNNAAGTGRSGQTSARIAIQGQPDRRGLGGRDRRPRPPRLVPASDRDYTTPGHDARPARGPIAAPGEYGTSRHRTRSEIRPGRRADPR